MKKETLQKKIDLVDKLCKELEEKKSIVIVDPIGLTVEEVTSLRNDLYKEGCKMQVIKNNIAKRAIEKLGIKSLENVFNGPTAIIAADDETSALRVVYTQKKELKKLDVKAGIVNNEVYELNDLEVLAKLPDKNGMLSMLLSVLQAPIRNFACVVKELSNIKEQ